MSGAATLSLNAEDQSNRGQKAIAIGHLERIRRAELMAIRSQFPARSRVLELGAGSGFQAAIIASWNCQIVALDLAGRPSGESFFDVQDYDGTNIPFPDESFDLVFSSNVLEHVANLPPLLKEIGRVLKPQGRALHLMPSSTWRLWTSLSHYGFIVKVLLRGGKLQRDEAGFSLFNGTQSPNEAQLPNEAQPRGDENESGDANKKRGLAYKARRALVAGPHGEYPSAVSELFGFSRNRWAKLFRDNGFVLTRIGSNRLFYTGYCLFQGMTIQNRRVLARVLGASCSVYIMRKQQQNA